MKSSLVVHAIAQPVRVCASHSRAVSVTLWILLSACGGQVTQPESAKGSPDAAVLSEDAGPSDAPSPVDATANLPPRPDASQLDASASNDGSDADDAAADAAALALDPSPCLTGGNVWYLDHVNGAAPNPVTLSAAQATFVGSAGPAPSPATVAANVSLPGQPAEYNFEIAGAQSASGLAGPLQLGITLGATNDPSTGSPTLIVNGGCGEPTTGAFDVTALAVTSSTIEEMTVAFEFNCNQGPAPIFRGCIHLENTPNE